MKEIYVGLRDETGGMGTLDYFEEEVTGVVGIIDVIKVAPMLIEDEVAAHGLDGLEEEEDGGMGISDSKLKLHLLSNPIIDVVTDASALPVDMVRSEEMLDFIVQGNEGMLLFQIVCPHLHILLRYQRIILKSHRHIDQSVVDATRGIDDHLQGLWAMRNVGFV